MSKHSTALKQCVVDLYLGGEESYESTGCRYGIDHGTVRKWVASYKAHGAAGLARKFSHYDADFKLSVLSRMWEDGLSYRQAAAIFDIRSASCLGAWERGYRRGGIEALTPRRKGRPRSMPEPEMPKREEALLSDDAKSRDQLLAELAYLRMENAYLKKLKALTLARQAATKRGSSRG